MALEHIKYQQFAGWLSIYLLSGLWPNYFNTIATNIMNVTHSAESESSSLKTRPVEEVERFNQRSSPKQNLRLSVNEVEL